MRFRIRSLLFVPIAWAVAYLIACNFLVNHAFVSWNHNIARSNIQQIQAIAQRLYAENPAIGLTEFSDHQWIAGSLESPNPWGHRYQIRKIGQPNRMFASGIIGAAFFGPQFVGGEAERQVVFLKFIATRRLHRRQIV